MCLPSMKNFRIVFSNFPFSTFFLVLEVVVKLLRLAFREKSIFLFPFLSGAYNQKKCFPSAFRCCISRTGLEAAPQKLTRGLIGRRLIIVMRRGFHSFLQCINRIPTGNTRMSANLKKETLYFGSPESYLHV